MAATIWEGLDVLFPTSPANCSSSKSPGYLQEQLRASFRICPHLICRVRERTDTPIALLEGVKEIMFIPRLEAGGWQGSWNC